MTWDEINRQATGGGGATVTPSPKPDSAWARLNEQARQQVSSVSPIQKPIINTEEQPARFTAPTVSYEAPPGQAITAPLIVGKPPLGFAGRAVKSAFNVISEATTGFFNRLDKLYATVTTPKATPVEKITSGVSATLGAASLAFSPVSAVIDAAQEVPVLKYPAQGVNWAFQKLGEVGSWAAGKGIDALPIDDQNKAVIKPVVEEIGAFIAQYAGVKGAGRIVFGEHIAPENQILLTKAKTAPETMSAIEQVKYENLTEQLKSRTPLQKGLLKTFTDKVAEKTKARTDKKIPITANESQIIASEAVKEMNMPGDQGTMTVPTKDGNAVRIETNQSTVLRNLIKDQENLSYQKVRSLGNDINGEQIQARFEWDRKKQQGTIFVTKGSTAENIAHELGHYVDNRIAADVGAKLSDLLPDYAANKAKVNSSLTSYLVYRSDGSISAKEMASELKKLPDTLIKDIDKLTPGSAGVPFNERFANAAKETINRPEESQKKAPELTRFVQYYLSKKEDAVGQYIYRGMSAAELKKGTLKPRISKGQVERIPGIRGISTSDSVLHAQNYGEKIIRIKKSALKIYDVTDPPKGFDKVLARQIKESIYKEGVRSYSGLPELSEKEIVKKLKALGYDSIAVPQQDTMMVREAFGSKAAKELNIPRGAKEVIILRELKPGEYEKVKAPGKPSEALAGVSGKELKKAPTFETGKPLATLVVRQATNETANTDSFRGGTWYMTPESKSYDFSGQGPKAASGVGGPKKIETSVDLKNPLVIKNAALEDGSFSVINSGYEKFISPKYAKIAEDLYTAGRDATDVTSDVTPDSVVNFYLKKVGASDQAIEKISVSSNPGDAAMDFIISKALKEKGYDGLILENQYQGKVIDRHIFKLAGTETGPIARTLNIEPGAPKTEIKVQTAIEGPKMQPAAQEVAKKGVVAAKAQAEGGLIASTGLRTGKIVNDRLSYNPDKLNAPADVEKLFRDVAKEKKQFATQRISKSDADVKALAGEVGVTVDDLLNVRPGSIANQETIRVARQINMDMFSRLRDTIRKIKTEGATTAELTQFKKDWTKAIGVAKTIAGFRTESSNVLREWRYEVRPGENDTLRQILEDVKKIDAKAGDDLSQFVKETKKLTEPTIADKGWHLYYMSIFSGWSTQVKNIFGNVGNTVMEVARVAATNPKELPTAVGGLYEGLVRGWEEAKGILKRGDEAMKMEETKVKPIVFTGKTPIGRALAGAGNLMDYVGRSLSATDAFFRGGFRSMELKSLAREQAIKEGLTGKALEDRTIELYKEPTEGIAEQADQFAARGVYRNKPTGFLGIIANAISSAEKPRPGEKIGLTIGRGALRTVIPVVRTVANVINVGLDWTPIGFVREGVPKNIFEKIKGERTSLDRTAKQELGRAVMGTIAMTYFSSLAANGILSGNGPREKNKRDILYASGWRPNSVKIGDKWWPYQNWGPLAIPMTIVGNFHDSLRYGLLNEKDSTKRLVYAVEGSVNSILDMSFLSGASQMIKAVTTQDPSYVQQYVGQQVSVPLPNLVKQTAKIFDPAVYETRNIAEQIQYSLRITAGLKPRLNVFGEELKGDVLTQLQPHKAGEDPMLSYLADHELWVSIPSKGTIIRGSDGKKRKMTQDEYYNYIKVSGPEIKKELTRSLQAIKNLERSPDKQQKYIDDVVTRIRDRVKIQIQTGKISMSERGKLAVEDLISNMLSKILG